MEKIALFGTSADPPTIGHQTILHWLSQHYERVVVWAADNPFKQQQTPLKYRTEMLQLAIEEVGLSNIILYPEISDRYTLMTVNKAREIWGKKRELSLVIGSDILPQIHNWYRIEELLGQVKILIVRRLGAEIETTDLSRLQGLGGEYMIASLNVSAVSSSVYRVQKDQNLVAPKVRNYIKQWNLYKTSNVN